MAEDTKETGTTTRASKPARASTRSTRSTRSRSSAVKTTVAAPTPSPKKAPEPKKTWVAKVAAKNKQLDKLLMSERKFGGRLSGGVIKEIKKRVADKGPSAVSRMHFLGTPRQRKELARVIESILDA